MTEKCFGRAKIRSAILAALVSSTLSVGTLAAGGGSGADGVGLETAVTSGPLREVLEEFARQTGLQLVYSSSLGKGVTSPGAPAGLSTRETLLEMLGGTGLVFEFVNERTVTVLKRPEGEPLLALADPEHRARMRARLPSGLDALAFGQVVITGTHIPGAEPTGSQVVTIHRQEIERSGATTAQDVIRQLPMNFNGGPSEDTFAGSQESIFNGSKATGINFRGLGAGATLVLLNGRRMAAGAGDGRFVDISAIPISAIERIEIMPDGASAIYGADAVGAVVNFILRDDYVGTETQLSFGTATGGGPDQQQIAQSFGREWGAGHGFLSFEFSTRDSLPATDRLQSAFSDLRFLGGDNFDTLEGNPGTIISPEKTWAIPHLQNGESLTEGDLTPGTENRHNMNQYRGLLPSHKRMSVVGTLFHELDDTKQLFFDLLASRRDTRVINAPTRQTFMVPSSNAFYVNPTGGTDPIVMSYDFSKDLGAEVALAKVDTSNITLGVDFDSGESWTITPYVSHALTNETIDATPFVDQVALSAALADSNPATAFNPFGDGSFTSPETLAAIRDDGYVKRKAGLLNINVTAHGKAFHFADRDASLAVGADFREHSLKSYTKAGEAVGTDVTADRTVSAVYAELSIPLIADNAGRRWLERATLSLAGRHEDYDDFGDATTPRIGLNWSPFRSLTFRGAWSRSFKAPNLIDLDESANILAVASQFDATSPTGTVPILAWAGGNADLQEERATSWTAGMEFKAPERGIEFELTYFNTMFKGRAERVDYTMSILEDPMYAEIVRRDVSAAERETICSRARFLGDAATCATQPVSALVDLRLKNLAITKTSGIDLLGNYTLDSRIGEFRFELWSTYLLHFAQARFSSLPAIDLVSTPGNPIDLRSRAKVSWFLGNYEFMGHLNYSHGYRDVVSVPYRDVSSWTTTDLRARYHFGRDRQEWLSDTTLMISVQNVFNKDPPFLNNPAGIAYDAANADLLGRTVLFTATKHW